MSLNMKPALILIIPTWLLTSCVLNEDKDEKIQNISNQLNQNNESLVNINQSLEKNQHQIEGLIEQIKIIESNQKELASKINQQPEVIIKTVEVEPKKKPETESKPIQLEDTKLTAKDNKSDDKITLGSREWGFLELANINLEARIDTGATTSSLSAANVNKFERDGEDWVKFVLDHPAIDDLDTLKADGEDVSKVKIYLEAPIERYVRIIQSSSKESDRRPVVKLWLQVGPLREKAEFTLSDRSHMIYPILLGRSYMKDLAIVDVSQDFIYKKRKREMATIDVELIKLSTEKDKPKNSNNDNSNESIKNIGEDSD